MSGWWHAGTAAGIVAAVFGGLRLMAPELLRIWLSVVFVRGHDSARAQRARELLGMDKHEDPTQIGQGGSS